jgi:SAM-dependent methyltransferase
MAATKTHGSGEVQGALWGGAAEDWASLMEPQGAKLFEAVLARGAFSPGARVLDVGCGSGLFAQMTAARGCEVTGFDASEALLAIARRGTPAIQFHRGEMEALPFPDERFDIVTGLNSFQYAADPRHAVAEATRVVRHGGQVIVMTWGLPAACEATAYLTALKPLLPAGVGGGGPFALSEETALKALVSSAGLTPISVHDVDLAWEFSGFQTAAAALLSAGPTMLAIQASGRDRVQEVLERAIAPFKLANGGYRIENQFRYLVATKDQL